MREISDRSSSLCWRDRVWRRRSWSIPSWTPKGIRRVRIRLWRSTSREICCLEIFPYVDTCLRLSINNNKSHNHVRYTHTHSNTSPHLDIAYSGRMLDGMGVSKSSRCDGTQWNFNHIHSLISPHTRELLLLTDDVCLRKYSTRALRSNTGTTFEQISVPGKTWCFISCILCVRSSTCVFEGWKGRVGTSCRGGEIERTNVLYELTHNERVWCHRGMCDVLSVRLSHHEKRTRNKISESLASFSQLHENGSFS